MRQTNTVGTSVAPPKPFCQYESVDFVRRPKADSGRVGILAGSFNPPTIAHLELIRAARKHVDAVLCVVPREFPHKRYFGATLEQRIELLNGAWPDDSLSIGISEGGLFVEIAREFRKDFGEAAQVYFLCGADAAERIVNWDYGEGRSIEDMLEELQLLVAPRGVRYEPPGHLASRVHPLAIRDGHDAVSSTEVRRRIERGEAWEHLVPHPIVERVRAIYS